MQRPLHPLHAVLLAGTVPLFLAALVSDYTYANSYQIQWKNFASWLLVGGLVFGGVTLLWAIIDTIRAPSRTTRHFIYVSLLGALWILGFIDVLVHAGDAWASMPAALNLSLTAALLSIAATWLGFAGFLRGVTR